VQGPGADTARPKNGQIINVASSDSRDQAQIASEPENPAVAVGCWIGACRAQSAATATAGGATITIRCIIFAFLNSPRIREFERFFEMLHTLSLFWNAVVDDCNEDR